MNYSNFVTLFRNSPDFSEERRVAGLYFPTFTSIGAVPYNSTVIARYRAQPFLNELIEELSIRNCRLINSVAQVEYVNSMEWVKDLGDLTPKTWFEGEFTNIPYGITTVAKGKIRSIRERWSKEMLCAGSPQERTTMYNTLLNYDSIREQGIVFREYVPLKNYGFALSGMPIANEWRLFFYQDYLIDYGYYWINHREPHKSELPKEALDFALNCAKVVGQKAGFYSLDIAEKESGGWIVIELNEGQQSGLCGIESHALYKSLQDFLVERMLIGKKPLFKELEKRV